ncbi:MAG: proline dehydrogenase family protein [Propionibacteriaceae bacterium]|jgi:proline dehydrogenase|nr:proline dehydrogenase family protein [Propionibacteriaceae bacterium]
MIRFPLSTLLRNERVRENVTGLPLSHRVAERLVPGRTWPEAIEAVRTLVNEGFQVSLDYLAPRATDEAMAIDAADRNSAVLDNLATMGMARGADLTLLPSSLGINLPDGENVAASQATRIGQRAADIGATITIASEDHPTIAGIVRVVEAVRKVVPTAGHTLQARLIRSESDCAKLDSGAARARLCRGAYDSPAHLSYSHEHDINLSFVRCLKLLMRGAGTPLVATHDPTLIALAGEVASRSGRVVGDYEFQFLYGVATDEAKKARDEGHTVRILVPYGPQWEHYFWHRLQSRPGFGLGLYAKTLANRA